MTFWRTCTLFLTLATVWLHAPLTWANPAPAGSIIQNESSVITRTFTPMQPIHTLRVAPVKTTRVPQPEKADLDIPAAATTVPLKSTAPPSAVQTEERLINNMDVYALSPSARFLARRMVPPALLSSQNRASRPTPAQWQQIIDGAAAVHGLDPRLIAAVIHVESSFQVDAISPKGAQGLMQIMPETGLELGLVDPLDPAANVGAGSRYLKQQLLRFGAPELALAAYNAGPQAVIRHGGIPPYAETQAFVRKVMNAFHTGD